MRLEIHPKFNHVEDNHWEAEAKKVGKAFEDQKIWLKGIGRTVVDNRPALGRRGRKLSTSTTTFRAAFHLNL